MDGIASHVVSHPMDHSLQQLTDLNFLRVFIAAKVIIIPCNI